MSKLLVIVLSYFFIISDIIVKTTVLHLIAKVERKEKTYYLKHEIILHQKEKRRKVFQVKAISKDIRKAIVP